MYPIKRIQLYSREGSVTSSDKFTLPTKPTKCHKEISLIDKNSLCGLSGKHNYETEPLLFFCELLSQ